MAATVTETKPADQAATVDPADAAEVDALLAQANALAEEAAQVVADEPQPGAGPSVQAEASTAEPTAAVEASDKADPNVNSSNGIGSTLEDLDNLLEELGEKPPAERPEQPADDGASQAAGESPPAQGEADPQAAEVAGLEQQSPDDTAGAGESASADVAPAPPQALAAGSGDQQDGAAVEPSRSLPVRILHSLAAPAASLLAVMDIPFVWLDPRIKHAVGYLAVGTFVVAIGLWVGGPSLIQLRTASAAESQSPAAEARSSISELKASGAGSHSSGGGSHSSSAKPKSSGAGSHAPAKKSH